MIAQDNLHHNSLARWQWLLLIALPLVLFMAYLPAIRGGFIWDDDRHVAANPNLIDLQGLKNIWVHPLSEPQYYPMTHTSFWLEYHLWDLDPLGYKIDNVLLHAINSLLLWRLLVRLEIRGAALAAAIFALHPIEVESVAWISERKNVLSTCFALLSILAYLKNDDRRWPVESFLLFAAAMLSKTVACSLPAVLLVLIWWKRGRVRPADVLRLMPFFALGAGLGLLTAHMEVHHVRATGPDWDLSGTQRLLIAGRAVWFYLGKLFWPTRLTFSYPRWNVAPHHLVQFLFPMAALGLLIGGWILRRRPERGAFVAILIFIGVLTPALGFFNTFPMRYSFVADHFQYSAGIAIIVLFSTVVTTLFSERVLILIFVVVLAGLTLRQARAYAGPEAMWRDVLKKNDSSWLAADGLAYMFTYQPVSTTAELEEAVRLFSRVEQLRPQHEELQLNWGEALSKLGRWNEALPHFQAAINSPGTSPSDVEDRIGISLFHLNRFGEAEKSLRSAVQMKPADSAFRCDLADVFMAENRPEDALDQYQLATQDEPSLATAWHGRAMALIALNCPAEAIEPFEQYLNLVPSDADAHVRLGQLDLQFSHAAEGVKEFAAALSIEPHSAAAKRGLADAIAAEGKTGQ